MLLRFIIFCIKLFLLFGIIGASIIVYVIYFYSKDLPDYSELKRYYPPSITRIYSSDGQLMEEYAKEHRIFVPINTIPNSLINAFVAAEDKNFFTHQGIDLTSIVRAAFNNISRIANNNRVEGGSTITQQVVKNFLLSSERSLERKIKEAILSYKLSHVFTKKEILELYLNQIYFGKGAYGVAAASLHYFNKSVDQLTLNESAVLASLPKAPSKYNPERDYERALKRRDYVIIRMYDDDYITEEEAREVIGTDITLAKFDKVQKLDASYYTEKVRDEVIKLFNEEYFYSAGLTIITCVNSKMQKAAQKALRYGIIHQELRSGYRGPIDNIDILDWHNNLSKVKKPTSILHYKLSVILDIHDEYATIGFEDGSLSKLMLEDIKWAYNNREPNDFPSMHQLFKTGDVIIILQTRTKNLLRQIPNVNGGVMVMEPKTGKVFASVGGYNFNVSKFNRATQAKRQPGSLIKPFVYIAALEAGAKPNDIFIDEEIEMYQGANLPLWKPKNFEEDFLGPMTFRKGLEKSRNIITIKVGEFAGWERVANTIQRFGINDNPTALPSIVLGAMETSLSKMTSAYATVANRGYKVEPHYIELIKDRKGNIIYKRDYTECKNCNISKFDNNHDVVLPQVNEITNDKIIDEARAYQVISLMMGSVQRGTSRGAGLVKQIVAGKTGTTNDVKDAWFVGFTPKIVVGTYIGYDNPLSLGRKASGASVALPVFVHFMNSAYKNEPSIDFIVPDSVDLRMVDYDTGEFSTDANSIIEAFTVEDLE